MRTRAKPSRRGEAWNDEDIATLPRMAREGAPGAEIARALERTGASVERKAGKLKIKRPG